MNQSYQLLVDIIHTRYADAKICKPCLRVTGTSVTVAHSLLSNICREHRPATLLTAPGSTESQKKANMTPMVRVMSARNHSADANNPQ